MTEVALADHATLGVVLRHAVRTVPRAVLTADARVGTVKHDARGGIFCICVNRTSAHACRFDAVVAAHRQVRTERLRIEAAFDLADASPIYRRGVGVLFVARDHAAFAADAFAHVEVKSVLLSGTGHAERDARARWRFAVGRRRGSRVTPRRRQDIRDAVFGGALEQRKKHTPAKSKRYAPSAGSLNGP